MAERWRRNWRLSLPPAVLLSRLLFWMRVEGRQRVPAGPVIVAANHLSHVDPPFVGIALNRPVKFMAAADLEGINRGLDFFLPFYGCIPLPRTGIPLGAMKAALAHLEEGGTVGMFPEGRRVAHWKETPPYEGAAWLALRAGVPLVPAAVFGTARAMSLDARMVRPARIRVAFGDPLPPQGDRRQLTARWEAAVDDLLIG